MPIIFPSTLNQLKEKKIFFDTNVLIFLYWSSLNDQYEKEYSHLLNELIKCRYDLYIDSIVISEFINVVLRLSYKEYLEMHHYTSLNFSFKKYRRSDEGKEVFKQASDIVKNMMNLYKIDTLIIDSYLINEALRIKNSDFNDSLIYLKCKINKYALLTHDSDFQRFSDISILTAC